MTKFGVAIPADHYGGLTENWENGLIYCSEQTARLIQHMDNLRINPKYIVALPMEQARTVQGEGLTILYKGTAAVAQIRLFFSLTWPLPLMGYKKVSCFSGVEVTLVDANHCPGEDFCCQGQLNASLSLAACVH